jgi:hypothetical protein
MKRYFHPDGSITCDNGDPFFSDHEDRWRFTKVSIISLQVMAEYGCRMLQASIISQC